MEKEQHSESPLDMTISLEWTEPSGPNNDCHYNHCLAETPFGCFLLSWKGWKNDPVYEFDETPWGEVEYGVWTTVFQLLAGHGFALIMA